MELLNKSESKWDPCGGREGTGQFTHLNEVNIKSKGVNKTINVMFELIKTFNTKLQAFNFDILSNS